MLALTGDVAVEGGTLDLNCTAEADLIGGEA